jgi:predicted small lipoprotein YifL
MNARLKCLLVLAAAAALAACGGGGSNDAAPAPAANAPVADGDFGVAECDEYMRKYLACIDKMPEQARASARQALDQTKSAWKQAASTAEGKAAMAQSCKQASETAKVAMQASGCTW